MKNEDIDDVGADVETRNAEEQDGDDELPAKMSTSAEKMLEIKADDRGEGEAGPGATCGHHGASGEAGELCNNGAEDVPEVVVSKRRRVPEEVELFPDDDAADNEHHADEELYYRKRLSQTDASCPARAESRST